MRFDIDTVGRWCLVLRMTDGFLTTREAAAWLKVTPWLMNDWRRRGVGPTYFRLGDRLIRYRKVDLAAWLQGRRVDGFAAEESDDDVVGLTVETNEA